jgi:alkanesulfonate monooxygenase SsuD/methylene tetrahydromethanopterin reductase-like flavin-dependent oxidoreductase (luciferase family)
MSTRKMHLGMSLRGLGYHPAARRDPDVPADGTLRFQHYAHSAQAAERGKCDMIFFADGIGIRERDAPRGSLARSGYEIVEMEPMTLLPALAVVTKRVSEKFYAPAIRLSMIRVAARSIIASDV